MSTGDFNPDLLALTRESRGLTQKELADKAGISQGCISKYETGVAVPSTEHAVSLAAALDYDVSIFEWKDDSNEGTLVFHRKQRSLAAREHDRIRSNFKIARSQVGKLLKGIQLEDLNPAGIPNYAPDVANSVEEIAARVRMAWRLPEGMISNLTALIEKAGGLVMRFPFGNHKCDGLSQPIGHRLDHFLFFISADVPGDRYRYTLAHELGHAVMHSVPEPGWDLEAQANAFAGAFLLPPKEFTSSAKPFSLSKLVDIKPYWKVSIQAMVQRAFALKLIGDQERANCFIRINRLGYRIDEPVKIPVEQPKLLPEIIDTYRSSLGFSDYELAKMLGLTRDGLFERFGPGRGAFRAI
jgi:Zn-dependent peptidase ImmA (M78 family)/transcriptional regulator with XRE-family HTH domain